jgi:hypothetical protein
MKDEVHAFHGLSDQVAIKDGADDQIAFQARQITLGTAEQIIENTDLGSVMEVFDDVPADEAGASRN